jgi:hypothetical protein
MSRRGAQDRRRPQGAVAEHMARDLRRCALGREGTAEHRFPFYWAAPVDHRAALPYLPPFPALRTRLSPSDRREWFRRFRG